jgi:predicted ester cyclase
MPTPRKAFRRKTMIKTLSTEERVAIARDYIARVFNGGDAGRAREFFTKDVVWHGGALTGIKAEVQDVIASNDLVALRLVVSATQTGNLVGIPATGRRIQWEAVDIYRVRDDGKISEQWAFEDMAAILSQTGAAKLPWASEGRVPSDPRVGGHDLVAWSAAVTIVPCSRALSPEESPAK